MSTYNFWATALIIVLIPGTGVFYTISAAITNGKKAGLWAAFGCTMGIIPHLCISVILLSYLLKMSSRIFLAMKLAGAFYLVYLGLQMFFSQSEVTRKNEFDEKQPFRILYQGIFINLLNPKLTLFFFAFLPQYVSPTSQFFVRESLIYGGFFMLMTLLVFIVYGLIANTINSRIFAPTFRQDLIIKVFGLIFIVFAGQLLLSSI